MVCENLVNGDDDIEEVRKQKKSVVAAFAECTKKVGEHKVRLEGAWKTKNEQFKHKEAETQEIIL